MIFIVLNKLKKKPTKELISETNRVTKVMAEKGVKIIGFYWTLGRYDTVLIMEAPDEKTALQNSLMVSDFATTETMVAVPREEVINLVTVSH
jgi:uncharacterized protein with GYD domain